MTTSVSESGKDGAPHERAMQQLSDRTGAALGEIRGLFVPEFLRLELGATVRSYLSVLTSSNVRSMLRRKRVAAADR